MSYRDGQGGARRKVYRYVTNKLRGGETTPAYIDIKALGIYQGNKSQGNIHKKLPILPWTKTVCYHDIG